MSRRTGRFRRIALVALYLALLMGWGALTYDTYRAWLQRQASLARGLALAALGPTPQPTPTTPLPAATTPPATVEPTPKPLPTQPAPIIVPTSTPAPVAVTHPKTGRLVAAWMPTAFDAEQARASFEANKALLDEISPVWYTTSPVTGELVPEQGARDRDLIEAAQAADVLVIPSLHNVYEPEVILPLLQDAARREAHIVAIMREIEEYGYDGIDIDYELLPTTARPYYADFMRELSTALRSQDKLLTVAVHAKTTDENALGGFQDWRLLGELCDRVRIMTYDFSWSGGPPGPIAPVAWVAEVIEYARSVLPAAKIQVGIPFYGYNWTPGQPALPQTWGEVQQLISTFQPLVNLQERDATGPVEESWFTYSQDNAAHTVWFASARSLEAKLTLVEQEDLGGIAIWHLGNEDPRNWDVIRERFIDHPDILHRLFDTHLPEH